MKLATGQEMREIDRRTMEEYGIGGLVLMENAGVEVARETGKWLKKHGKNRVLVLCGSGNNGGDGLVAARHLRNRGYAVKVLFLSSPDRLSADARTQFFTLQKMEIPYLEWKSTEHFAGSEIESWLYEADVLLDGVYGTGFHGEMPELPAFAANWADKHEKPVLSIDIPSGVAADTGRVEGTAFRAEETITLALAKPGLLLGEGAVCAGRVKVKDIGIPQALLTEERLRMNLITRADVRRWLPERCADSHKGSFGHAVLMGGSGGMLGAVRMAAKAALKAGSGCVTAIVPASLQTPFQTAEMELMTHAVRENEKQQFAPDAAGDILAYWQADARKNAYALGMGLGRYEGAERFVSELIRKAEKPMVLDADGLMAIAGQTDVLRENRAGLILTPHPGEMAALTGLSIAEIEANRLETAREYAAKWKTVVVLKGHRTVVAAPDGQLWLNGTGNSGMATAGSGDVLSGLITGLLAQGMPIMKAALSAVYIHGAAGDAMAELYGEHGLIAGNLLEGIPQVLKQLLKEKRNVL